MGFGLSRSDVMAVAFKLAEASGRKHPFTDGAAGRAWFDGFRSRHPKLTLCSTQSLSHAQASSANCKVIAHYFGKLAAVCAKLNLLAKPMQIWNMDETGVTQTWKGGNGGGTTERLGCHLWREGEDPHDFIMRISIEIFSASLHDFSQEESNG